MFARINHELSEREALEQARQGLLKKKQSLIADNKKRKEDLANLDKDLETFIDVSSSVHPISSFRLRLLLLDCVPYRMLLLFGFPPLFFFVLSGTREG